MQLYGSLHNYIAMHRKRAALSKADLAVLVGLDDRRRLTVYEDSRHHAELEVYLGLEVALGVTLQDLFAGVAADVRGKMVDRARALLEAMSDRPTRQNSRKLETLSALAYPYDERLIPLWEDTA